MLITRSITDRIVSASWIGLYSILLPLRIIFIKNIIITVIIIIITIFDELLMKLRFMGLEYVFSDNGAAILLTNYVKTEWGNFFFTPVVRWW